MAQQQRHTIYHHVHSHAEFTLIYIKNTHQIPAIFPSFNLDSEENLDHTIICSAHITQCVVQCSENVHSCLRTDFTD